MGDVAPQTSSSGDYPSQDPLAGVHQGVDSQENQQAYAQLAAETQHGYMPALQHQYGSPQHAFTSQLDMAHPQGPVRLGPYNMNMLANALPQANYRPAQIPPGQQRFHHPSVSPPSVVGPIPLPQYPGHAAMNALPNQQFYMSPHPQMTPYYGAPLSPSQQQPNLSPRVNMGLYANQMVMNHHQPHPSSAYYYTQQYSQPNQAIPAQMIPGQYVAPAQSQPDPRLTQSQAYDQGGTTLLPPELKNVLTEGRSSIVRGPPRKPRQSGHAIWIGNLPPQAELMNLVHHVCKEADGLESLFLISKSNCAFANFRDEPSCVAAQQKLHDSKFQSVRLVSRLRKSTVEGAAGVTAPTGPAASAPQGAPADTPQVAAAAEPENTDPAVGETVGETPVGQGDPPPQKDKFFILKSLTVEDLELSVQTGIWATQSHNEETLNSAFKVVDNVYLIFSANKSGEYFGYARMISPINEDPAAAIEFAPKAQSASDVDLPRAIATEATEFAPKGRIIDDSARGTIFWEAERDDASSEAGGQDEEAGSGHGSAGDDSSSVRSATDGPGGESKAWGKPFKLEWLSTARLPFYRTRGLRNPWNSNREVKIARDGTELEPMVGRRLIGLFNRVQSPGQPGQVVAAGLVGGVPRPGGMTILPGFPPAMRAPYHT